MGLLGCLRVFLSRFQILDASRIPTSPSRNNSWGPLGGLLGPLGGLLEPHGGLLGPSWRPLGGLLGPSWGHLGASWGLLGASWGHLGGHRSKEMDAFFRPPPPSGPSNELIGALLGRSWAALGRSWGRPGALWGPFWGPLGPSWSHLEASDGHRKRKGEKANIIDFLKVFEGFWLLGEVLRGPRAPGTVL